MYLKYYIKCIKCGKTNSPYRSLGMCRVCYYKSEENKKIQRDSREKNKEKRKIRENEYLKEYLQRPYVKEKSRKRLDEKKYSGNREKAVERDNYKCTECGLTREQSYKLFGNDFCVVRIDGDPSNNELNNFKTLCRKCFQKNTVKKWKNKY